MTREDITRMARQAGINVEQGFLLRFAGVEADLERFAALVAAAEREACIDLVAFYGGPVDLEAAIRARGQG